MCRKQRAASDRYIWRVALRCGKSGWNLWLIQITRLKHALPCNLPSEHAKGFDTIDTKSSDLSKEPRLLTVILVFKWCKVKLFIYIKFGFILLVLSWQCVTVLQLWLVVEFWTFQIHTVDSLNVSRTTKLTGFHCKYVKDSSQIAKNK